MNLSKDIKGRGYLHLIIGCMYAGKSTEAMRRARIFGYAEWTSLIIKHGADIRYDADSITSHDQVKMKAVTDTDLENVHRHFANREGKLLFDCVVIDEIQMFNERTTVDIVCRWKDQGIYVICAGLDLKASREWYYNTFELFRHKDNLTYLQAFCINCKEMEAAFTWSDSNPTGKLIVGGLDKYIPVCGKCYDTLSNEKKASNAKDACGSVCGDVCNPDCGSIGSSDV